MAWQLGHFDCIWKHLWWFKCLPPIWSLWLGLGWAFGFTDMALELGCVWDCGWSCAFVIQAQHTQTYSISPSLVSCMYTVLLCMLHVHVHVWNRYCTRYCLLVICSHSMRTHPCVLVSESVCAMVSCIEPLMDRLV